jgi:hypothetical protein
LNSLKKIIIILGLSLCAWDSLAEAKSKKKHGGLAVSEDPSLQFETKWVDLGSLYQGQQAQARFDFKNISNEPVTIQGVHASCGCLQVKVLPSFTIPPGERGWVEFQFDSNGFQGEISRTITLDLNSEKTRTKAIMVKGMIKSEIRANPAVVNLGTLSKQMALRKVVQIVPSLRAGGKEELWPSDSVLPPSLRQFKKTASQPDAPPWTADGKTVELLEVTTSSPTLIAKLTGNQLEVSAQGVMKAGPYRERITIWNNSRYQKALIIPVIGEWEPQVSSNTRYVEFGVVPAKTQRTFEIESKETDFEISKSEVVASDSFNEQDAKQLVDSIELKYEKIAPGKFKINVSLNNSNPRLSERLRNVSGKLIFTTNDSQTKKIEIPFFGVLKYQKS